MEIRKGETYLLKALRDEVICTYVAPKEWPLLEMSEPFRMAVFEFKIKVAAYHAIPFTLPLAICDHYLAELPQMAQA